MAKLPIETIEPMRIYVVGGGIDYIRMFYEFGFRGAAGPNDADVICFTGGADVDPQLYGERALSVTSYNVARDKQEIDVFDAAVRKGTPMVGICRGAQFLNVMCGGKLWQDVNNHAMWGTHELVDIASGEIHKVTSTHHQQMIPDETGTLLAAAAISTRKLSFGREIEDLQVPRDTLDDAEVVWYESNQCLCFQPHPEIATGKGSCRNYFKTLFDAYIFEPMNMREGV